MTVNYQSSEVENRVGLLTHKHTDILFALPVPTVKKLFNGTYNEVRVNYDGRNAILLFKENGKPGFVKKTYRLNQIRAVRQDWMNDPILNRSGLAALIWNDKKPNDLRRRLENRVKFMSFTKEERDQIIREVRRFADNVERSLSYLESDE